MKKKYIGICILFIIFVFTFTGCQFPEEKEEHRLIVKKLENLSDETIMYSKSEEVLFSNLNNIYYDIQEFYSADKKEYVYVLNYNKKTIVDKEYVPFDILRWSIAALPHKTTNTFTYMVNSPTFVDFMKYSAVDEGSYYLFSSKKKLANDDFQVEGMAVNAIPIDGKKAGEETTRFYSNGQFGLISD